MRKKILFCFGLMALALLFCSSISRAAGGGSIIKITPSIVEEMIKPGEAYSNVIKLTNESDAAMTLYAYLKDFKAAAEDESGKAQLIVPGTEQGNYISSWLDISTEGVALAPGETKNVPYTVNVPANVGPGGYYGAIVFGTQAPKLSPGEAETGAAIGVAQQAASLLLLQVPGKADERAEIREFKTDRKFYTTPFDVNFITRIINLGNVHVKPRGVVEIRNMMGKKVSDIIVNDDGGNILPKSSRLFNSSWKDTFGFGRYEAQLAISYGTPADQGGEGKKTLTMFWYFWVFPAKVLIAAALSLILLIALFVILTRVFQKIAIKKAMEQMGLKGRPIMKIKKNQSARREYLLTALILAGIAAAVMAIIYFLLF